VPVFEYKCDGCGKIKEQYFGSNQEVYDYEHSCLYHYEIESSVLVDKPRVCGIYRRIMSVTGKPIVKRGINE